MPPKPNESETPIDIAWYSIYNKDKNIKIAQRLLGLQNILRAELTAIHDTIKLTLRDTKSTYIFTDSLNSIYLINTQLKHPTSQNNHPNKLLLQEIIKHINNKLSTLHIHKVKAHKGIQGNEEANKLAKQGAEKETLPIEEIYHNTHTSPHWLHRAKPCQYGKPFKDLNKNYQKYL
jgi:ribonuclease HI